MADVARAEELVQTIERDSAFRQEVEGAPTLAEKRSILDAHGFKDVGLDDMKEYVESQGGTLTVMQSGRQLSDQELDAVVGGDLGTDIGLGIFGAAMIVGVAAIAAG